ncbi:MAG TPA: hypothetical protein PKA81_02270 [Clostridia bacterium]|nr:hypothetical protein [Clostridia bacterium]
MSTLTDTFSLGLEPDCAQRLTCDMTQPSARCAGGSEAEER